MTYQAPLDDIGFALNALAGLDEILTLPGLDNTDPETIRAILAEAGKFAGNVLAPLNHPGDKQGSRLENGKVRTPDGFAEAYRQFVAQGWNAVAFDPAIGGQGLPWAVSLALQEIWNGANMAFALCPMLTQAVIDALTIYGTEEQRQTYLPPLVSGTWTGTMELTEPQAGSDSAQIRTVAKRQDDGTYRLRGQKIFITYGEQDFTPNIIHAVLARTEDAPAGIKGLSLFLVPHFLPHDLTQRNDIKVLSLEHKMGIHASPTCVMSYGEQDGAVAYLLGQEQQGMEAMFTLMNNARINVGMQGIGIAEAAYQQAVAYARDRHQGRADGYPNPAPIIAHADIQRQLLTMRSLIEANRALALILGGYMDRARRYPDPTEKAKYQTWLDLLTPIVKAWGTETGVAVTSMNIQVHGGMGYIEETGAAQLYRDARIAPIYEGTNGIQASDLLRRKLLRDDGAGMRGFIAMMRNSVTSPRDTPDISLFDQALTALETSTQWILDHRETEPQQVAAAAVPYLMSAAITAGGWAMIRSAELSQTSNAQESFKKAKMLSARHYAATQLPLVMACQQQITLGGEAIAAFPLSSF